MALVFPSDLEGLTPIGDRGDGHGPTRRSPGPVSSLPELVIEGENGFLIEADNLDGWVAPFG